MMLLRVQPGSAVDKLALTMDVLFEVLGRKSLVLG